VSLHKTDISVKIITETGKKNKSPAAEAAGEKLKQQTTY
jgi:hypothetical protein